jgi:cellulose synthase/poly-beta-1,6-N-acetylglucosamine synthase-like glycosyltransferase
VPDLIFFLSAAGVIHAYVFYPALIWLLSRRCNSGSTVELQTTEIFPPVAILVAAHNEEAWIGKRIANALAVDYPRERMRVVIASDGSEDRTNEFVKHLAASDARVHLLAFSQRRGKAATLNDAITQIDAEIVMFSDANTMYEHTVAKRLVARFADPSVGVVCGRLILHDAETGRNIDSLYWRYETFIKKCEAKLGGLLGANGAIYAMRRELYQPIPSNTIIDDFVIPLLAKLRCRCRLVYEERAVAHEETALSIGDEFRRRSRIGAGGYQSLAILWPLLNPIYGWTAFTFWNHKVLRWCVPALLLAALVTNIFLWRTSPYHYSLAFQVGFYCLAIAGLRVGGQSFTARLIRAIGLFCIMNVALAAGFWQWLFVRQRGTWRRTAR